MNITVKRIALRPTYTIGKMYINGKYYCDTLEDTVRDLNQNGKFDGNEQKIYGQTAIPYGTYRVLWTYSPRFKKYMPELKDVPEFSGVRIHAGNTNADTLGCILVGQNKQVGKVINSKATVDIIYPIIRKACQTEKVFITIE